MKSLLVKSVLVLFCHSVSGISLMTRNGNFKGLRPLKHKWSSQFADSQSDQNFVQKCDVHRLTHSSYFDLILF
jgi:hypothetical protein